MPHISFFRPTTAPLFPLPPEITRTYIPTPSGPLELLIALPPNPSPEHNTPIFFAHGGCGSAAVWIPYMLHFSQQHQIPCFALSYRGHGGSWYPGFLRMYFTWMGTFAGDLALGIRWMQENYSDISGRDTSGSHVEVVLVGHSSGGGLGQYVLSEGMDGMGGKGGEKALRVKGLVLAGSIPGFGSSGVNINWLKLDPYFLPRMYFKHFGHPMSPLSTTALVKQAFFSASYPLSEVAKFEKLMPKYESFLWPLGMLFPFVNFKNIVSRITGWGTNNSSRILILAGQKDKLVSLDITRREADEYRDAVKDLVQTKKLDGTIEGAEEEGLDSTGCRVEYRVVGGAGHHFQNDSMWEEGAEKLLRFYVQL